MRVSFPFIVTITNLVVCRDTTPSLPPCARCNGMIETQLPTGKVVWWWKGSAVRHAGMVLLVVGVVKISETLS